jgi:alpha-ketoglutarate-dependent dioxygenase alkB family protein 3
MLQESDGDYTYMQHVKIPLSHGSLLIMEGATQVDWQVKQYMLTRCL